MKIGSEFGYYPYLDSVYRIRIRLLYFKKFWIRKRIWTFRIPIHSYPYLNYPFDNSTKWKRILIRLESTVVTKNIRVTNVYSSDGFWLKSWFVDELEICVRKLVGIFSSLYDLILNNMMDVFDVASSTRLSYGLLLTKFLNGMGVELQREFHVLCWTWERVIRKLYEIAAENKFMRDLILGTGTPASSRPRPFPYTPTQRSVDLEDLPLQLLKAMIRT